MGKRPLRRKPGNRPPKDRVFILTEGRVTEVEYLRHLCGQWGLPKELVVVEQARHSDPPGIVDEAIDRKRHNAREARRGRDVLIDQWWVVCDTEGRPETLKGAMQKACANDILLALSDPSVEFWLRLHFGYTSRQYNTVAELIKELRSEGYLPGYTEHNKHPDMQILYPRLAEAMRNARLLRANLTAKGEGQPRTDWDVLIDAIASQAQGVDLPFDRAPFQPEQLSTTLLS